MVTPHRMRQFAAECLRWSEETDNASQRDLMIRIAKQWMRRAAAIERYGAIASIAIGQNFTTCEALARDAVRSTGGLRVAGWLLPCLTNICARLIRCNTTCKSSANYPKTCLPIWLTSVAKASS